MIEKDQNIIDNEDNDQVLDQPVEEVSSQEDRTTSVEPADHTPSPEERIKQLEQEAAFQRERAQKFQRKTFAVDAEANQWREQAQLYKNFYDQSTTAAMSHYDQNLTLALENAKQLKRNSIENGDIEGSIAADLEMAAIVNQITEADKAHQQRAYNQQLEQEAYQKQQYYQQQAQYQQQQQPEIPPPAVDWLRANPWFVPGSPQYNAKLAEEVQHFTNQLDAKIAHQNRHHEYLTPDYFAKINNFVKSTASKSNFNMNQSRDNTVSGVSRGGSSGGNRIVTMNDQEKRLAKIAGVSEKEWITQKIRINEGR